MSRGPLGWTGIVRLGLVQSALGAIVAFATTTLNRVMVVEYAMPAILPAGFIAWHYASGLALYWAGSNLIGIGQQAIINRTKLGKEMREIQLKRALKKKGGGRQPLVPRRKPPTRAPLNTRENDAD